MPPHGLAFVPAARRYLQTAPLTYAWAPLRFSTSAQGVLLMSANKAKESPLLPPPLQQLLDQPAVLQHLRNADLSQAWANLLPLKARIETHGRPFAAADRGFFTETLSIFQ